MDSTRLVHNTMGPDAVAAAKGRSAKPKPNHPKSKFKRPPSAFHLFYRYKHQKILAISRDKTNRDVITRLVQAAPGLEDYDNSTHHHASLSVQTLNDLRRDIIRKELKDNLLPQDQRDRSHRTNQASMNGAMSVSFFELGELMKTSWKACDYFAKSVFTELANEGREYHRQRIEEEYNSSISEVGQMKDVAEAETKTKAAPTTKEQYDGSDEPNKNDSAKMAATAKPDHTISNGGSAKSETEPAQVRVRTSHLLCRHPNIPTTNNIDHASTPSPQDLLLKPALNLQDLQPHPNRDVSYTGGSTSTQDQLMGRTVHRNTTKRTVSNDDTVAPLEIRAMHGNINARVTNNLIRRVREIEEQQLAMVSLERLSRILRIRELEDQIASTTERLRSRKRLQELESLVMLDRVGSNRHPHDNAVENQLLRVEREVLSQNAGLASRAHPGTGLMANPPTTEGLASPLANNTRMNHPDVRALLERDGMLSRMMDVSRQQQERRAFSIRHPRMVDDARHQEHVASSSLHWPLSLDVMHRQDSTLQESNHAENHRRMMDCVINYGVPNKRQRYN